MIEIESSIRGGLTTVVQGKAAFNNKSLSDYDTTKPITSEMFGFGMLKVTEGCVGKLIICDFSW